MATVQGTRPPAVAGMFYPNDPGLLRQQIRDLYASAPPRKVPGSIRGIVSPHAGYVYSGQTAARAYSFLKGQKYETVVVLSPSHREHFDGVSVYPGDAYRTPLGVVPIDTAMREEILKASSLVRAIAAGHRQEHAVEVQLPFLQEILEEFKLLPLVMGDQRREQCMELGRALSTVLAGKHALLVASTDLSHYHSAREASSIDRVAIDDVGKFDYEQLMSDLENGVTEACGGGPTVAMLAALHELGVDQINVVHHCTSGDITGETGSVVGYCSAVAWS